MQSNSDIRVTSAYSTVSTIALQVMADDISINPRIKGIARLREREKRDGGFD